ncbi:NPCBM/NEW2 domain-containing protein [Streptomyces sp. NBC_00322]|uniref:NPCBM/NEW2 domain-containing protein n=1 Tax=Streptomyces sp. NBC_00322 TaxID=2975712 RepID=UPI003FA6A551
MPAERHTPRQRLAAAAAFLLFAGGTLWAGAPPAAAAHSAPTPAPVSAPVPAPPPTPAVDGLARTPQMGFNNWNSTYCGADFNEAMVKGIADTFVSQGLKAAGYTYVNIDDCWALPNRDASGNLVPDPVRFPHGIKAVADYVHSKGLKFGIYSSAGTKTCDGQGFPGGLGHERQDANLWASWGVDYLKYDNCNNTGTDARQRYKAMADALKATGRPILHSICEWGVNQPWNWAAEYGNSWRTTFDIRDNWSSMIGIAHQNQPLARYAGPGAWNDPDMLEVGNGGMTDTEYRTHFSLWAQMAAPLLIGSDLRSASAATLAILKNTDVIAVDQDSLGRQGTVVSSSGGLVVMSKPLADGGRSVTLTNETTSAKTLSTTADAIGIGGAASYVLEDLWSKQTGTTTGAISASVPAHGTVMYRVTPGALVPPPTGVSQLSDLPWMSAVGGWGPVERDRSNGEQAAEDGRTLTVGGTTYAKGLGTHAASDITYYLGGGCRSFSVDVGVDDESSTQGSVVFQVYRDGTKVADSGLRTASDPPVRLSAGLTDGTKLRLVVTDGGDGIDYDHADWANARLACGNGPSAGTHAVSDLNWTSAVGGWGPVERDRSNGERAAEDGRTLTVGGTTYAKGLGTHAASDITYYLGGSCSTFTASVGVDDETGGSNGSVVFQVYRDGTKVADSGRVTGADAPRVLSAGLTGGLELRLVVAEGGDGINYDHADWAVPRLSCA